MKEASADQAGAIMSREEILTCALSQALIVKKGVSAERSAPLDMETAHVQCPSDCHACCCLGVVLDLTAVESLLIYLLNGDVIEMIDEYTRLHEPSGYCPFMIMDKCIINDYKPSACQMFMPFDYQGKAMCTYIAEPGVEQAVDRDIEELMNSSSYDIHGFMMMIQCEVEQYIATSFFKNIYDGVRWWKENYLILPEDTRICLESILSENAIGDCLVDGFDYGEALHDGYERYDAMLARHRDGSAVKE